MLEYLQCTGSHTSKSLELQLLAEGHVTEQKNKSIFSREPENAFKGQKGNSVTSLNLKGRAERQKRTISTFPSQKYDL